MAATPKQIIFEEEARELLLKGIKQPADVVAFTLGPKGKNVGIEKSWGAPIITNDGNSILKEFEAKNQFENMGITMAKEVAQKVKEKCGDGTSTAIVLLGALVANGIKQIASGASPINLKRGMEKAVEAVVAEITKKSIAINSIQDVRNVAIVSASGNEDIGKTIAEAMEKIGQSAVITIEEAKSTETTIDIVEGMQFDRGYISAYFSTNNDKMVAELTNAQILLTDKKINNIHDLLHILQQVATSGKELLIIAEDVEGDVLSTLVVNKLRGTLKVCAVKAPGFGDKRKALLEDIAIVTGGTVISEDKGMNFKEAGLAQMGSAEKIIITKETTTIINGNGSSEKIKQRIEEIEAQIKNSTNSYDKESLEKRKAQLSGGVAVIRVGAATEPEMKQKKQLFEDSLNSTRAAQEEGIVPGGGVALLKARNAIQTLKLSGDEALGAKIVWEACTVPLKQIVLNTGLDGSVICSEVEKESNANWGFDAKEGKCKDLVAAGIIDPAKVVKHSLTYAASVAGIVLITEALIGEAEEEEEKA